MVFVPNSLHIQMKYKLPRLTLTLAVLCLFSGVAAAQGWTASRLTSSGRDLNAVYFIDSKRGWVGGDSGFLSYTDDGGGLWVERRINVKQRAINDIYFVSSDAGFILAGDTIFSSNDSGHNWQEAHRFPAEEFQGAVPELYSLRFNGKKRGWVVGSISRGDNIVGSILAITRDGGATWQAQDAQTKQELIHIDFVDDKRGWIVGADGAILHTDNAGESWVRQESHTSATLFHVDFRNEKQGLAVGERGTILLTSDGGASWRQVDSTARATLLSVEFISEDESWIVGRNGVILRSGDGGRTWVEQESGTKQPLYALFMNKKIGWAVGSDGLILSYKR
jgi:photosystem II stability/assembly factor-like uncharacterized protein